MVNDEAAAEVSVVVVEVPAVSEEKGAEVELAVIEDLVVAKGEEVVAVHELAASETLTGNLATTERKLLNSSCFKYCHFLFGFNRVSIL